MERIKKKKIKIVWVVLLLLFNFAVGVLGGLAIIWR
jgi:hypothetical protein